MNTRYSFKKNQEMTQKTEGPHYELMDQSENQEEEDAWLSQQFNRVPFQLYKFWLILHTPIILILGLALILRPYLQALDGASITYSAGEGAVSIGSAFFLSGCYQMLFAINKRKSKMAQEGFVKFQYVLIAYVMMVGYDSGIMKSFEWLLMFYIIFLSVTFLLGGFAVLKAFKRNHPLARIHALEVSEGENRDFLKQNEDIASEFSKYDEQLERWPYLIYKYFLKSSVIFQLRYPLLCMPFLVVSWKITAEERKSKHFNFFVYLFLVERIISTFLNAYSCLQMEIGMRTRNLEKSQGAIFLLKICIVFSIIACLLLKSYIDWLNSEGILDLPNLLWHTFFILDPFVCLIPAFKVKKIIEEREKFIKVSSYSQDLYL